MPHLHKPFFAACLLVFSFYFSLHSFAQETCLYLPSEIPLDISVRNVVVGDFDDTNLDDFAVATEDGILVFLNDGNGSFDNPKAIKVDNTPGLFGLAVFDVDADDDLDLIAPSGSTNGRIFIFRNQGDGSFELSESKVTGLYNNFSYGDIDADGDADLVGTSGGVFGSAFVASVAVYENDGNGDFSNVSFIDPSNSRTTSSSLVDMDGDKDLDLVLTGLRGVFFDFEGVISWYENDGTEIDTDNPRVLDGLENEPISVFSADFDGDLDNDLAVLNNDIGKDITPGNELQFWINDGIGNLSPGPTYPLNDFPFQLSGADIDGDQDIDLLATSSSNQMSLLTNNGGFDFSISDARADTGTARIGIGDFDQNENLDIVSILGGLDFSLSRLTVHYSACVVLGDVNLDSEIDLLDVEPFATVLVDGIFQLEADVNQDGELDLLDILPFVELILNN